MKIVESEYWEEALRSCHAEGDCPIEVTPVNHPAKATPANDPTEITPVKSSN